MDHWRIHLLLMIMDSDIVDVQWY